MAGRTAKVHLNGPTGTVEVGGADLSHAVQRVAITGKVGCTPTMTLDLVIHQMDVDGEMHVQVPEDTAAALIVLGWAPPDDSQPIHLSPRHHDLVSAALRHMARTQPDWLDRVLRREMRMQGRPVARLLGR